MSRAEAKAALLRAVGASARAAGNPDTEVPRRDEMVTAKAVHAVAVVIDEHTRPLPDDLIDQLCDSIRAENAEKAKA